MVSEPSETLKTQAYNIYKRYLLFAKRTAALGSVAVAVYVLVGCLMYGEWWYGWLWQGEFKDTDYTISGLMFLLDNKFKLVMIVIAAIFLAVVLGGIFKTRLFRIVDRFSGYIVFTALLIICTTFLVVYHTNSRGPDLTEQISEITERTSASLRVLTALPAVETPIDFDYIDANRVDALHNQIEPELIEKQRTLANDTDSQAKASIGASSIKAEVDAGKKTSSTSSFSRTDFSTARKCVDLMKFVVNNSKARYYTTSDRWMTFREIADSTIERQNTDIQILVELFAGRMPSPTKKAPSEEEKRLLAKAKQQQNEKNLQSELQDLQGLVFVDGVFDKITREQDVTLVSKFSTQPHQVYFRVSIPVLEGSDIRDKSKLRIFGDVVRPLRSDGYVDIRAIAVY